MASSSAQIYYSCPCSDITGASETDPGQPDPTKEDQTFDPSNPRANFALYPLENLLFCNECHELRCPRCYYEEVLYYYCPSCLLETQATTVKNETNRCTRSCFQCPICTGSLSLSSFQTAEEARITNENPAKKDGPFILSCPYCSWSTLEIGIRFEKSINVSGQLAKLPNGSEFTAKERPRSLDETSFEDAVASAKEDVPQDHFSRLASFYREQLTETTPGGQISTGAIPGFDSPSHLSRLLSNYGVGGIKKQKGRVPVMREPLTEEEGIQYETDDEQAIVDRMQELGWDEMTDADQRSRQANGARFFSDLRPISTQLRSKRAKRCGTCRNYLIRPEDKRQSTRYKIRLPAVNYIPRITVKPLDSAQETVPFSPGKTMHMRVTLRNPLFETIKVTLATSPTTPGNVSSKVTILCPQFEVGASSDVWDEALDAGSRKTRDMSAVEGQQPEAGKVWERGRNWTTVILEVVPGNPKSTDSSDLEVPVFVRMEYETEDAEGGKTGKDRKTKRELAWWTVLSLGKIAVS